MKTLFLVLTLLLSSSVSASDLSDFPDIFPKENPIQFVKGHSQSSKHVQASLDILLSMPGIKHENKIDTDRRDFGSDSIDMKGNFVLIGGPCQNEITRELFPDSSCFFGLDSRETLVLFEERGSQKILLLVSPSDDSLIKTASMIRNNGILKKSKNNRIVIKSNKKISSVEIPERKIPEPVRKKTSACCETEYGCIKVNSSTSVNGKPFYCSDNNRLVLQSFSGECVNDYECVSNSCFKGSCSGISWWKKLILWIKSTF